MEEFKQYTVRTFNKEGVQYFTSPKAVCKMYANMHTPICFSYKFICLVCNLLDFSVYQLHVFLLTIHHRWISEVFLSLAWILSNISIHSFPFDSYSFIEWFSLIFYIFSVFFQVKLRCTLYFCLNGFFLHTIWYIS